ncbi:MAG: transposase [Acidimicrobiia bacterium]|nr:transposase [Acidimicrobiia bacterium]
MLVAEIGRIHAESDGTYGEPRMTPELRSLGHAVNHKRVARLMRLHGIVGVHKPAKVRTTIPAQDAPPLPDLVGRRFDPGQPDVAWVGDIERHEALSNRAVVKGHSCWSVAADWLKLTAA